MKKQAQKQAKTHEKAHILPQSAIPEIVDAIDGPAT